jgi:hypothetical protein
MVLAVGCVGRNQPSAFDFSSPRADPRTPHIIYLDGRVYVERGIVYGAPPPDTLIPATDPEVGAMEAPTPSGVGETK